MSLGVELILIFMSTNSRTIKIYQKIDKMIIKKTLKNFYDTENTQTTRNIYKKKTTNKNPYFIKMGLNIQDNFILSDE